MSRYYNVLAVSSRGKELEEVNKNEGVNVKAVEMSRQITPVKDLISLYQMCLLFISEKPDIVHTHTPKAGFIGMLAAWITGIPHRLHTVAGLPLMESRGIKREILLFVERLTYRCATHIYPNSQGLKKFIVENGLVDENRVKVLANGSTNGIDTHFFQMTDELIQRGEEMRQRYGIKKDAFVFIFVGRIVTDKGINELLSAFDKITTMYHNVKLLLVGSFEETLDPVSERSKEILTHNMHIIKAGFQEDVRPFFALSDCLVFPSYREGFPNVVMQAGAMGLPAIVSDINGCNEIIEDGVNGIVVPPKDEDALYEAVDQMIRYDDLRLSLAKDARRLVVERYDQQLVWQALKNEYEQLRDEDAKIF